MALKSKLSKLLTAGNLDPDPPLDHAALINQLQFGQANKVTHMIAPSAAHWRAGRIPRQLEGLQMMGQQELWRIAHGAAPFRSPMYERAEVGHLGARQIGMGQQERGGRFSLLDRIEADHAALQRLRYGGSNIVEGEALD